MGGEKPKNVCQLCKSHNFFSPFLRVGNFGNKLLPILCAFQLYVECL